MIGDGEKPVPDIGLSLRYLAWVGLMNRIHCVGLSAPTHPYAMPRRRPKKYREDDSQFKI